MNDAILSILINDHDIGEFNAIRKDKLWGNPKGLKQQVSDLSSK